MLTREQLIGAAKTMLSGCIHGDKRKVYKPGDRQPGTGTVGNSWLVHCEECCRSSTPDDEQVVLRAMVLHVLTPPATVGSTPYMAPEQAPAERPGRSPRRASFSFTTNRRPSCEWYLDGTMESGECGRCHVNAPGIMIEANGEYGCFLCWTCIDSCYRARVTTRTPAHNPTTRPPAAAEHDWPGAARALWGHLDDIDTLDDAVRGDDVLFRERVRKVTAKRHNVLHSDGYNLEVPVAPAEPDGPDKLDKFLSQQLLARWKCPACGRRVGVLISRAVHAAVCPVVTPDAGAAFAEDGVPRCETCNGDLTSTRQQQRCREHYVRSLKVMADDLIAYRFVWWRPRADGMSPGNGTGSGAGEIVCPLFDTDEEWWPVDVRNVEDGKFGPWVRAAKQGPHVCHYDSGVYVCNCGKTFCRDEAKLRRVS